MPRTSADFTNLQPASNQASKAARGSSKKSGTGPEMLLRRRLWARGLRYRVDAKDLPGRPDIVFRKQRVAIFVDGDFWHGRNWPERRNRLADGHNADYWVKKIQRNIDRDDANTERLEEAGWKVIRVWESEIKADPGAVADEVAAAVKGVVRYG